jgi:hypothetical protein
MCDPLLDPNGKVGNGYLQQKAIRYSFDTLIEHMPLELNTRNAAIYNSKTSRNCTYYMS